LKILVTGGLGYIGSHVTTLLLQNGMEVVVVDNLENTRIDVLDGIESITGKRPNFKKLTFVIRIS
jgi:UDP-glucose 4-epimerase